jgi:hypothetical protein
MTKLIAALPCPFCGKPPFIGPADPENEGNAFGFVECRNKKCVTYGDWHPGLRVQDGSSVADERGSAAYKNQAIRRWNRRKA